MLSDLRAYLAPPPYEGSRLTAKRLLNLYLLRFEGARLRTRLVSYPIKLTVEPTNTCNLRCPACFTGDGQVGRVRGMLPLGLYRRLLDELGDYLFQIEFANWGEPLLNKSSFTMFREAKERGLSTMTSTHLSLPFDADRAAELVSSGLDILGVSLDGARQESYERYRVRGAFETVLHNCRLVQEAKRRLGSPTPRMVWEFHVFAHNAGEVEAARSMATELGMEIEVEKGWTVGGEWDAGGPWQFHTGELTPFPCLFLWHFAVVNNDGGVSPCCGSFYREDDMGRLALGPGTPGETTFRAVWNGPRFREARRLYRARRGTGEARSHICFDCPNTITWQSWREHARAGGTRASFIPRFTANDSFNYFWNRGPARDARRPAAAAGGAERRGT
jgi:pyruvate-formate lyase-activating enzyme